MDNRLAKQFKTLVDKVEEIYDFLVAFDIQPPQGELAKEQAVKEFTQVCNQAKKQIDKIRNTTGGKYL